MTKKRDASYFWESVVSTSFRTVPSERIKDISLELPEWSEWEVYCGKDSIYLARIKNSKEYSQAVQLSDSPVDSIKNKHFKINSRRGSFIMGNPKQPFLYFVGGQWIPLGSARSFMKDEKRDAEHYMFKCGKDLEFIISLLNNFKPNFPAGESINR